MGFTSIQIRDNTYAALAGLRVKAFESQKGVALDLSLSDVIDTLLETSDETLLEFEVTVKGHLTCDKDELDNVARDKRVAKVAVAADYVARTIHDMARPGTGPLVFEEVTASTRHIKFTE